MRQQVGVLPGDPGPRATRRAAQGVPPVFDIVAFHHQIRSAAAHHGGGVAVLQALGAGDHGCGVGEQRQKPPVPAIAPARREPVPGALDGEFAAIAQALAAIVPQPPLASQIPGARQPPGRRQRPVGRGQGEHPVVAAGRELRQKQRQIGGLVPAAGGGADTGPVDGIGALPGEEEVVEMSVLLDQPGAVQVAEQGEHRARIR